MTCISNLSLAQVNIIINNLLKGVLRGLLPSWCYHFFNNIFLDNHTLTWKKPQENDARNNRQWFNVFIHLSISPCIWHRFFKHWLWAGHTVMYRYEQDLQSLVSVRLCVNPVCQWHSVVRHRVWWKQHVTERGLYLSLKNCSCWLKSWTRRWRVRGKDMRAQGS